MTSKLTTEPGLTLSQRLVFTGREPDRQEDEYEIRTASDDRCTSSTDELIFFKKKIDLIYATVW